MGHCSLHLGVEDASVSFDDADSLIESLERIRCAFTIRDDGCEIQHQVLGVKLGSEVVADTIALSGGDLNIVSRSGQVAYHLRLLANLRNGPEISTNEAHTNRLGLLISKGEEGLGRVAVDKLDTKDL